MPEAKPESPEFFRKLEKFARDNHETFWLGTRFLPRAQRQAALMVLCLDGEFHRIISNVQEEMIAQIRLQWWRDEVERLQKDEKPQGSLAGRTLFCVLGHSSEMKEPILQLIDAYDDVVSGAGQNYAASLFSALFVISGQLSDERKALAETCGQVFQSANTQSIDQASLEDFIAALNKSPDDIWPWLCLFEFTPEWVSKSQLSPLTKRWRVWRAYLGGEARLKNRLSRLLD